MNSLSIADVQLAYRKLKSLVYYDKTDLKLRQRLAEFECDSSFMERLLEVKKVINTDDPLRAPSFRRWLNEINFRVIPKNLEKHKSSLEKINSSIGDADSKGKFISNVTSEKIFRVARVNYFFDGPIELHLIAVLWIMREGRVLDAQLGVECYGSRLDARLDNPDDRSVALFRRYHELYARWRDSGIRKAKQLLSEEQTSVCILGLDIQEYYYHIRLDFREIARSIYEVDLEDADMWASGENPSNLLRCLEAICIAYREKINLSLRLTHKDAPSLDKGIPIGLCSSPLLANWYLRNFDKAVKTLIRPAYYGRYIDDILLVVPATEDPSKETNPVESFMNRVLVQEGLLHEPRDNRYEIVKPGGLFLQQGKCILQYFDSKHSIAGLEKFQKKLEENGSDFLLLPVDEGESSLEEVYELLYDGSVNKFRSVKGMAENRYELAKHLARQTILHLLTDDLPDRKISLGLRQFFKGKNAIEFHDLWERVFTFFLIAGDTNAANAFAKQLEAEIKRVQFWGQPTITSLLVSSLETHLKLSLAMAGALGKPDLQLSQNDQTTPKKAFRRANLVRHHFVRIPLLNYTTYSGPLTTRIVEEKVELDPRKLELSPRYVNFDECLLLAKSRDVKLYEDTAFQWASTTYKVINGHEVEGIKWDSISMNGEVISED